MQRKVSCAFPVPCSHLPYCGVYVCLLCYFALSGGTFQRSQLCISCILGGIKIVLHVKPLSDHEIFEEKMGLLTFRLSPNLPPLLLFFFYPTRRFPEGAVLFGTVPLQFRPPFHWSPLSELFLLAFLQALIFLFVIYVTCDSIVFFKKYASYLFEPIQTTWSFCYLRKRYR